MALEPNHCTWWIKEIVKRSKGRHYESKLALIPALFIFFIFTVLIQVYLPEGGEVFGLYIPEDFSKGMIAISIVFSVILGILWRPSKPYFARFPNSSAQIVEELRKKNKVSNKQSEEMRHVIGREFDFCKSDRNKTQYLEALYRVSYGLSEILEGRSGAFKLETVGIERITEADSSLYVDFIKEGQHSIKAIGISGHVILEQESLVRPILREKIGKQVEIKVLLMNPNCSYIKEIAKYDGETEKSISSEIETGLAKLSTISEIEIKTYFQWLSWGAIFIDDQKAIVMHYIPSRKKAHFLYLTDGDNSIFKSYKNVFDVLWRENETIRKTIA